MRVLFTIICLTVASSIHAQRCFLKTDTIYLFLAQTRTDLGTNGITKNPEEIRLSFENKVDFFCSLSSSLSYSHPFLPSIALFLESDLDRESYSECIQLEGSMKQEDKALKKIHKHYRSYFVKLRDGTKVRVRVVKMSATLLAYERNNRFIASPISGFDAGCYKAKYSYFYHSNISWIKFDNGDLNKLESVFSQK